MSKNRRQAMRTSASGLVAVLAFAIGSIASAQDTGASAAASLEVIDAVGTGINIDLATELLSGIFLAGRTGDTVSILVPGSRARTGARAMQATSGSFVLSASSYRLDLGLGTGIALTGGAGKASFFLSAFGSTPGSLLYLAQFN